MKSNKQKTKGQYSDHDDSFGTGNWPKSTDQKEKASPKIGEGLKKPTTHE
jgi:hypothetical protein